MSRLTTVAAVAVPIAVALIGYRWFKKTRNKKDELKELVAPPVIKKTVTENGAPHSNGKPVKQNHTVKDTPAEEVLLLSESSSEELLNSSRTVESDNSPVISNIQDDKLVDPVIIPDVVPTDKGNSPVNNNRNNNLKAEESFEECIEKQIVSQVEASLEAQIEHTFMPNTEASLESLMIQAEASLEAEITPCVEAQIEASIESQVESCIESQIIEPCVEAKIESNFSSRKESIPEQVNGCDAQSEVSHDSHDSGKGNSIAESHPHVPDTPPEGACSPGEEDPIEIYEFLFPAEYCGMLIGRQGRHVAGLKAKSGADIRLSRMPFAENVQICIVTGHSHQVAAALELMKKKFPYKKYNISFEQLNVEVPQAVIAPPLMQMSLPEGVSVDVMVTSVIDVNHIFVQQPTHPTFSSLERLNHIMNSCYGMPGNEIPELPHPIEAGAVCAAPMGCTGWYRAQVCAWHPDTEEVELKYVDYGGYATLPCSSVKQIRSDFTTLPFQASECYMSNVIPPADEEAFSEQALAYMNQLVFGRMLSCQITAHDEITGNPYIHLFENSGPSDPEFVNRNLVDQGFAQWLEME